MEGWKISGLGRDCHGCEHLVRELVGEAHGYRCKHETAIAHLGCHPMHQAHGILIGEKHITPAWCPAGKR